MADSEPEVMASESLCQKIGIYTVRRLLLVQIRDFLPTCCLTIPLIWLDSW